MDAGEGRVGCVAIVGMDGITVEESGERKVYRGRRGHSRERVGGSNSLTGTAAQSVGYCFETGSHSAAKANLKLTL